MREGHAREYKRVAGVACLDFVNTVSGRIDGGTFSDGRDFSDRILTEWLTSYEDFLDWTEQAKVLATRQVAILRERARRDPAAATRSLRRAKTLRDCLYRLFKAAVEGWPPIPADLDAFNRRVADARSAGRIIWGERSCRWALVEPLSLDAPLHPLVTSAADLLTSSVLARLGQCPGDQCGWLFLDTSRGGRRKWCDMTDCGNVAKARRHRRRKAGSGKR